MAATDLGKVGIIMKGNYNAANTYEVLDAVYYSGGTYIAKQAVPANTAPTNTTYWQAEVATRGTQTFDLRASNPIVVVYPQNTNYFSLLAKSALVQGIGKVLYWITVEGTTVTVTNVLTGATVSSSQGGFNVSVSGQTVTITTTYSSTSYIDIII